MTKARVEITAKDRSKQAFDSFNRKVARMAKGIVSARGAIGALIGAAGLGAVVSKSLAAGDKIQKLSIRLNESTEALSQYQHVADITGVSFDDIANAFAKLQKGVADAEDGLSTTSTALEDLGINIEDIISLSPSAQFEAIADAIIKIENPAKRTQIAMDLMGRAGSRMLSTMAEGGDGIRKLREEYDAMGGSLSQVDANQMANANDAMARIGASARITGQLLAASLAPHIEALAEKIRGALPYIKELFVRLTGKLPSDEIDSLAMSYNGALAAAEQLLEYERKVKKNGAGRNTSRFEGALKDVNYYKEKLKELEKMEVSSPSVNIGGSGGDSEGAALASATEAKVKAIEAGLFSEEEKIAESFLRRSFFIENNVTDVQRAEEIKLGLAQEFADKHIALAKRETDKISAIKKRHEARLLSFERARTDGAIALASALGKKSKAFAIAAFAAEKFIAAKRIVIQANVAAMAALTPPPIGLGPVAGAGLAAKIKAAGYTSAGLIAATGIVEGINQFGGGSDGGGLGGSGGGGSSVDVAESRSPQQFQGVFQQQQEITIPIYIGGEKVDEVIIKGVIAAAGNDQIVAETESGRERVIFSYG